MPSEHRKIAFSAKEVIDALANLNLGGRFLPPGTIVSIKFVAQGNGVAGLVVLKGAAGDRMEYTATPERLAAALINYCRARKIPLPRAATKQLALQGDNVALVIDVPSDETAPTGR